jgi:hypothetical protein
MLTSNRKRYPAMVISQSARGIPAPIATQGEQVLALGLLYNASRIFWDNSAAFASASSTARPLATPGRLWPA